MIPLAKNISVIGLLNLGSWHQHQADRFMKDLRHEKNNEKRQNLTRDANRHSLISVFCFERIVTGR